MEGDFLAAGRFVLSIHCGGVDQPEDLRVTWAPACKYLYAPQMAHSFIQCGQACAGDCVENRRRGQSNSLTASEGCYWTIADVPESTAGA